jgi:hypothetical protein
MARAKRKKAKAEKARRLHQEPIVRRVAELLETGTPTRWRWTSEARHGLRAAMCLRGAKWDAADKRAEEIVTLARHRIGLSRAPTWSAVQELPSERLYFYCGGCGGYIDGGADRPWCSKDCNKILYKREWWHQGGAEEAARRSAMKAVLNGGAPPPDLSRDRLCRHCSQPFTPANEDQRHCSWRCSQQARAAVYRDCLMCSMPFQPRAGGGQEQLFCSRTCMQRHHDRQRAAPREARPCRRCGAIFEPPVKRGRVRMFCSDQCRRRFHNGGGVQQDGRYVDSEGPGGDPGDLQGGDR